VRPELLAHGEIEAALGRLEGWSGDGRALERGVTASDFATAIRIMDEVAAVAEELDHHPDIDIRWRTLRFSLRTHVADGVTERDVELARRIEEVIARHGTR
jgi:4a-hydroxytetrahydrobiopterin dehydratase